MPASSLSPHSTQSPLNEALSAPRGSVLTAQLSAARGADEPPNRSVRPRIPGPVSPLRGSSGAILTNRKLHEGLVVFGEHIKEQIQDLELPEVLVVFGIVGEVGQVGQYLLLGLCNGEASGV